ncbi:MAG: acyl carrier protein [Candidatus Omnitrophica bacterium]|nr:acyl carrier protein [Candidatus Omnitrophota bacterium]
MEKEKELELYNRVKKMLIVALRLKISPENIKNEAPLFGEGLGLDSIDALEVVLALEKEFGARIPDATVGARVLVSVDGIVNFIKEKKQNEKAA